MSRELTEIQREHERIVRKIGLVPETRKFTPHVTLARLKKVKPVAVADYLSFGGILVSREFSANAFVVFSSRDSTGGGPYVIEAAYPLTPE